MVSATQNMSNELRDWRAVLVISGMIAVIVESYLGVALVEFAKMPHSVSISVRLLMAAAFVTIPWLISATTYRKLHRDVVAMKSAEPEVALVAKSMRITLLFVYIAIMFCIVAVGGWPIH